MCLGTKCDGAKMCLVVLGTKLRWGQIVSGDKMFGPKGVRPKMAGPNCEAALNQMQFKFYTYIFLKTALKLHNSNKKKDKNKPG